MYAHQSRGCTSSSSSARLVVSGCMFKPLDEGPFPRPSAEGTAGEEQLVVVDGQALHAHFPLKEENGMMYVWMWICTLGCSEKTTESGQPETVEENRSGEMRFVVLGDAGEGNQAQYDVAAAMEQVSAEKGCDFALYLGDGLYDTGVESVEDSQFLGKFEQPYTSLTCLLYVVLGNHDYGSGYNWDCLILQVA